MIKIHTIWITSDWSFYFKNPLYWKQLNSPLKFFILEFSLRSSYKYATLKKIKQKFKTIRSAIYNSEAIKKSVVKKSEVQSIPRMLLPR